MHTRYYKEYSHHLNRDMEFKVYGHAGLPMVVFPCQDGKYFDFEDVRKITLPIRGYGWGGKIHVKTEKYGEVLCEIGLHNTNIWFDYSSEIALPNGVHSLYLTYTGGGSVMLRSVRFD